MTSKPPWRRCWLRDWMAGGMTVGFEAADGCRNAEGQGQDDAGGGEVTSVEGQTGDVAGHEACKAGRIHSAWVVGGEPDGVVRGEEERSRAEDCGCGYGEGGDALGKEDAAEDDGGGVPEPGDEVVLGVEGVVVDAGGEV